MSNNEWHIVKEADRERIHCQNVYAGATCNKSAVACLHLGRSVFYYCKEHATERGFQKPRALLLAKLQGFVNAAVELEHAFGHLETEDDLLTVARDYPFDKAFEELLHDIFEWRDSVQAATEPIRCVSCGAQGEHIAVQAMVSGVPGLVCCGPETCPKCGTPHSSTEFEDEGEGDEAGRTFRYCSEACKEKH